MEATAERLLAIVRRLRDDVVEMSAKGLRLAATMPGNDDTAKIYFDLQFFFLFLICADGSGSQSEIDLYNLTFGTRLSSERLANEIATRADQIAAYGESPSHLMRAGFMVDAVHKNTHYGDRVIACFEEFGEIVASVDGGGPSARQRLADFLALARVWQKRAEASLPSDPEPISPAPKAPAPSGRPAFGRKGLPKS
ncbi:MAG: hypothetical protein HQL43_10725 [Alphaproteobacteria bacterium]|nr:hypothetical protein [Alphaproteobacteria bacterium]